MGRMLKAIEKRAIAAGHYSPKHARRYSWRPRTVANVVAEKRTRRIEELSKRDQREATQVTHARRGWVSRIKALFRGRDRRS